MKLLIKQYSISHGQAISVFESVRSLLRSLESNLDVRMYEIVFIYEAAVTLQASQEVGKGH